MSYSAHVNRILRLAFLRKVEDPVEVQEGNFGFPVGNDHISQFLQRREEEERIEQECEIHAGSQLFVKYQQQQYHDHDTSYKVDRRALQVAHTPDILHFLQLESEDLVRCLVQALDLLVGESEAFDKFYVAQRFRCGPCERGGFLDNTFLNDLYFPAEQPAGKGDDRNRGEVD